MRVRVCQRKIHFPPEECVCDAFDCDGQSTGPRDRDAVFGVRWRVCLCYKSNIVSGRQLHEASLSIFIMM